MVNVMQVSPNDDDKVVLARILVNLANAGETNVQNLIRTLGLHRNPHGRERLKGAVDDELVEFNEATGSVRISPYGERVAKSLSRYL